MISRAIAHTHQKRFFWWRVWADSPWRDAWKAPDAWTTGLRIKRVDASANPKVNKPPSPQSKGAVSDGVVPHQLSVSPTRSKYALSSSIRKSNSAPMFEASFKRRASCPSAQSQRYAHSTAVTPATMKIQFAGCAAGKKAGIEKAKLARAIRNSPIQLTQLGCQRYRSPKATMGVARGLAR